MIARERVADRLLLDGRLALYHEDERWLAVADVHFGYEISQRCAGWLTPVWGMEEIKTRLHGLLDDYQPQHLVFVGDLVHDRAGAVEIQRFLTELREICNVTVVAGNHDRHVAGLVEMVPSWETPLFVFHHGHCTLETSGRIQIIGHHHPAGTLSDGAGLRLKLPAFVMEDGCWVLPAFSPWAAGAAWKQSAPSRVWLCSPQRILRLPAKEVAA